MLVLTRKLDQTIKIGEEITITIVDIRNGKVRIGIEAPLDTPIARGELLEREPPKP